MKTNEELNALKEEVETQSKKCSEPSEEELEQVAGGEDKVIFDPPKTVECPQCYWLLSWCGEPTLKCDHCGKEFRPNAS